MTSNPLLDFGLLSFVSLFTMINPLGVIPVYTAMTASLTPIQSRRVALKATLTAFLILLLFALTGQLIFQFFSISVNSLRVVGGVLFFFMGYEMLQARLTRTQYNDETTKEYLSDISITPLGIPMICGPGAITTVILLMQQSTTLAQQGILLLAAIAVITLTFLALISARRLLALLGEDGNKVLMRLMGLILMVIAVEFFFSGLKPILRDILAIQAP